MFSLKDFLTAMVLAFICLLVRITPACAAQVEIFIPTENCSFEIITVEATTNESIHSPPQEEIYEEIQVTPDKMRIDLTTENDIIVETFYPVEEADYGQYVAESPVDDDIIFMLPLITHNADQEVVMALTLSATDFPYDNDYETMAQFGLMYFF